MKTLRYIEHNNQPVVSARDLYACLTEGKGIDVCAWLEYCANHKMMSEGVDYFCITTDSGHDDLLLLATCAAVVCACFKSEKAKECYGFIRELTYVQSPMSEFFTQNESTISISEAAKIVVPDLGPPGLFRLLRECKILMKNNIPYQNFINGNYFQVRHAKFERQDGTTSHYAQAFVTDKGLDFIKKVINKNNRLCMSA